MENFFYTENELNITKMSFYTITREIFKIFLRDFEKMDQFFPMRKSNIFD